MTRALVLALTLLSVTTPAGAQGIQETVRSLTGNDGIYSNRIVQTAPPLDYTEVCIVNGEVVHDEHLGGEPTTGGNCPVGAVGWIIKREERTPRLWTEARMDCLADAMRLPEAMESQFSCLNADQFGLVDMTGNWEWASNHADLEERDTVRGLRAALFGLGSCDHATWGNVGRDDGQSAASAAYRCSR